MSEALPLATLFREAFTFLATRNDAAVFGGMAVNAYCATPRMTEDIDVLSTNAKALAEALGKHLGDHFHIAVRVRSPVPGGFRVYQRRKPKNRHLVDVRQADELPPTQVISGVRIIAPVELVAMKVRSIAARTGQEKGLSDRLDLHRLLNTFPELRALAGPVAETLGEGYAALWAALVAERVSAGPKNKNAW